MKTGSQIRTSWRSITTILLLVVATIAFFVIYDFGMFVFGIKRFQSNYQESLGIYIAFALGFITLLLVRPRDIKSNLLRIWSILESKKKILIIAIMVGLMLPVLGMRYANVKFYMVYFFSSALSFLFLILLLMKYKKIVEKAFSFIREINPYLLGFLFLLVASLIALFVLDDVPHISDEIAYQFQAKAFANGKLFLESPPLEEFFDFVHIHSDGDKWYGILNPGWSAILSLGYLARNPWLVNPLIGALTLLIFYFFYKEAGFSDLESKLAIILMAISPFVIFLSASYMSHPGNLFLFGLFAWSIVKIEKTQQIRYSIIAGIALGLNLIIRPSDTIAVALPFILYLFYKTIGAWRYLWHIVVIGIFSVLFAGLLVLYNQQLTGEFFEVPMSVYFEEKGWGKFGLGFGPEMGTTIHGPEWPGYYPVDAIPVTSYRISELVQDFNGFPLMLVIIFLLTVLFVAKRDNWQNKPWVIILIFSALCLFILYVFHFYHGIAFGPRHYYLAVPAISGMIAILFNNWITNGNDTTRFFAKLAFVALILHTLLFPYPRLLARYGAQYRGASAAFRNYVSKEDIKDAVLFIEQEDFNWKSSFPLNSYPLDANDVIFAKSYPEKNRMVMELFPDRKYYLCSRLIIDDLVQCQPINDLAGEGLNKEVFLDLSEEIP